MYTDKQLRNFWKKVIIPTDSRDCWTWSGGHNNMGRPMFSWGTPGKMGLAARFIVIVRGEDVDGKCVCHTCDNPTCINPNHMWVGTHQDNMDDMAKKGRKAVGANGNAKVEEEDVRDIRELYATGGITFKNISRFYTEELHKPIAETTVYNIVRGISWKHVN